MKIKLRELLASTIILLFLTYVVASSTQTFVVSFQNAGGWSTKEWVEFDKPIPILNEFTACHWEKIRYFSSDMMSVWAYCIAINIQTTNMNCTQLYTYANSTTANRQLVLSIEGNFGRVGVNIEKYRHRTWNHICWSYSSLSYMNKFYYNGKLIGVKSMKNGYPIPASDELKITSFILGQEPDSFNGKFSVTQLLNGEVSELNLWDTLLRDDEVLALAHCKSFLKGNILPWEKMWIKNHGTLIKDEDLKTFCKEDERLIVFPKRHPKNDARDICTSHGGQLITPNSREENEKMMRLLHKHKDACMENNPANPSNTGKAAWLGLTRQNYIWYSLNADGDQSILNFTNWWKNVFTNYKDTDCSFANTNGEWNYEAHASCVNLQLCTICKIVGTPVFTINGFCQNSLFDFNYYLVTDEKNTIKYYEGYKASNIIKTDNSWVFSSKRDGGTNARIETKFHNDEEFFPVGRLNWNMYEPRCGINTEKMVQLSMSKCKFGDEFTCDSGNCIAIDKRCNQVLDCDDESDENECKLVEIPATYRKVQPPVQLNTSMPLKIFAFIEIVSIDVIDTLNMHIGLTLNLHMEWKDSRLTFANLIPGSETKIGQETVQQLWVPLDYVTHENALIGEIYQDSKKEVEIRAVTLHIPMKPKNAIQNTLYDGASNIVAFKQRYRLG